MRKAGSRTAQIGKWHLSTDAGHGRDWDHSVVWFHSDPKAAGGYYRNQELSFDGGPLTAVDGYSTDNYTRYALDFIRRRHDKPLLLLLCYDAVHAPTCPPGATSPATSPTNPCRRPPTSSRRATRTRRPAARGEGQIPQVLRRRLSRLGAQASCPPVFLRLMTEVGSRAHGCCCVRHAAQLWMT
ncbi:MAG: sulfatase-like hydrolase/transferase [Verrucomicrobiia bacterium]